MTIVVVSRTQHGEQVCVCGSIDALGAWSVDHAVAMATDEASFPVWQARVAVPAGVPFEFKLFVRPHPSHRSFHGNSPRFTRWEPPLVGNRHVAALRGRQVRVDCGDWGLVEQTSVHVLLDDDALSSADLVERFHRNGYVVFPRALSRLHVEALRRECAQSTPRSVHLFADGCIVQPPTSLLDGVWRRDPVLRRIYIELARALLGDDTVYLLNEQFIVKMPHLPHAATEFAYHQDQQYLELPPGAPLVPYLSFWTALTDMSEENGTVIVLPYVPGGLRGAGADAASSSRDDAAESSDASEDVVPKRARKAPSESPFVRIHCEAASRYGAEAPPRADDSEGGFLDDAEVPLLVSAGDVVAMSSLLWHRSDANISDQIRIVYMPQFAAAPVRLANGVQLGIDVTRYELNET